MKKISTFLISFLGSVSLYREVENTGNPNSSFLIKPGRLFTLIILLLSAVSSSAQQRRLTVNLNNQPLTQLFRQIQEQCDYSIIYSDEVVTGTMLVSVNVSRSPVSRVLDSVLSPRQLYHQVLSDGMIVIGSSKHLKEKSRTQETILSGKVADTEGRAVPFATIALLEDLVQVNGAIGNEHGEFKLSHTLNGSKTYTLKISSIGFEILTVSIPGPDSSVKALGTVRLKPKAEFLTEVKVNSIRKVIEMEGGNLIFNVSESISSQGSNALELLGRAPGVSVGTDNSISLNGKFGAAVLIDGKQTYLSGKEIAELLRSMSSSDIRSIEIINSPSAKYDASGTAGIINVRTIKSQVQGFNAALTAGLSYGVYLKNNQDLSLNFRKNRFNLFGNYSHFLGHYSYLYGADRLQEGKFYNSFTDDVDKRKKMNSRMGADFAIDKNQTLGIMLNGNFIFGGGITDTRTEIGTARTTFVDQVLTANNDYYYQQTQRYNVNVNYKYEDTSGRIINFDADYGDFTKGAGNLQSNKYTSWDDVILSDNLYRSLNAIDIGLKAVKVDFTSNLFSGKLETGAKYSSVAAGNDSKFFAVQPDGEFLDQSRSNRFVYQEEIASAYLNYKRGFGKWQLQGGVRVENSNSEGILAHTSPIPGNSQSTVRNYTNLFPFFSATVKPSASHSLSIGFSKRIDRPAYQNLNPFIYLLDELSYWQGNPFLEPQLSHRGQLLYANESSTLGLSYTYTDNFSVEVTDTVDQTRIVMVPRNLGVQRHLALTVTRNFTPYPWWDINFNGVFFELYNKIDFGAGRKLQLKQKAARLSLQQTFKLPHRLKAEVVGLYNSRRLAGANQFSNPTSKIDIGIQRSFLANKASLKLIYSDIYKGTRGSSVQTVGDLYIHNYSYFESRLIKLNFSYRFSSGNSKGPRTRSSALENENGRIK